MKAAAIMISALAWGTILNAAAGVPGATREVKALLADDDSAHEIRALVPFIANLAPQDIPEVVREVENGHGPGREKLLEVLAGRWVEVDPQAALVFARHDEFRDFPGEIFDATYSAWVRRDPAGATAAVAQMPQGGERAAAACALATFFTSRDPAQAYALMRSIRTTRLEDNNYPIFWNWARQDLGAATRTLVHDSGYGANRPGSGLTWAVVDSLLDQNPRAATQWVAALPAGRLHEDAFEHLVETWARLDPTAAIVWLQALPASDSKQRALSTVTSGEGYSAKGAPVPVKADPAFAPKAAEFRAIMAEPYAWRRFQRLLAFVDGLAPTEFPLALEQIRRVPPFDCEDEVDMLMARWTEVDLAGAVQSIPQARGFYDEVFATRFLTDLFKEWSRRDPDAAFAYVRQMPRCYELWDVQWYALAGLARENPAKAYAAFKALNDPNRQTLVTPIFTEWAAIDLPGATKALAGENYSQSAIEGIIRGVMRKGFPAAATWADHLQNPESRDLALESAAAYSDNPEAAMAWLEKGPSFKSKNSALNDVAIDWANRNSISALRYALQLPEGKERGELMMWALTTYTYDDAAKAAGWCERLPDGATKRHSLCIVFADWAECDAQAAADYLSAKPGDATSSVLETVVDSWGSVDPPAAARWLAGFPTRESKTPAIAKLAEKWQQGDPAGAAAWVNQLPPGVSYDAGAKGISEGLYGDLAVAVKWAESIGDPKLRHDQIYSGFQTYVSQRLRIGDFSDTMKDAIRNAKDLTVADKKKLIDQMPVLQTFLYPKPLPAKPGK